jgi:hypothetical protein
VKAWPRSSVYFVRASGLSAPDSPTADDTADLPSVLVLWQLGLSRQLQERFGEYFEGLALNLTVDVAAAAQAKFPRDRYLRFALTR